MPDSQLTKKALADAMKELMKQTPMEKIHIGDIVKHCNMNRQSFYYHFKDKYDLVNWIFYTEFVTDIHHSISKKGWDLLESICEFFYENRSFYANALTVKGQNSFSDYLNEIIHTVVYYDLEGYFQDDNNQDFCATFLTDAICTSIVRWLLEGAQTKPPEFVKLVKLAAKGATNKILDITPHNE